MTDLFDLHGAEAADKMRQFAKGLDRDSALAFLVSAGILDANGELTEPYRQPAPDGTDDPMGRDAMILAIEAEGGFLNDEVFAACSALGDTALSDEAVEHVFQQKMRKNPAIQAYNARIEKDGPFSNGLRSF